MPRRLVPARPRWGGTVYRAKARKPATGPAMVRAAGQNPAQNGPVVAQRRKPLARGAGFVRNIARFIWGKVAVRGYATPPVNRRGGYL